MTQICLPTSGRALFAASETGTIRSYNYPLTGQYTEYQVCMDSPPGPPHHVVTSVLDVCAPHVLYNTPAKGKHSWAFQLDKNL
eukprot:4850361-Pyramimonas_sp.AAC.1